jgi:serine/threonine protein kinase
MGDDEGLIKNLDDAWNINYEDLVFEEEIGKGGFGSVYKGEYFGTPVAIKRVVEEDPDGLLYLEREVNVLKGMRHPNIVQFIGISLHDSGLHIITEYVKNGNLRTFLKDPSIEMPWALRALIAHDVACAMAYLHSRNVIHRDLKSKNLLVGDNWKIKVCDFGFARTAAMNRPMTLCGTDDWMAPEMILGMQYDNKIDVFSYGVVLVELITRLKISTELQRKPSDAFGLDVNKFRSLVPKDCPPEFAELAIDCCAYEPKDRPSFKDVIRRIKPVMKIVSEMPARPPPSLGTSSSSGSSSASAGAAKPGPGSSSGAKPQPVKTPTPTPVQPVKAPTPTPVASPSTVKPQPVKTPTLVQPVKVPTPTTSVAKPQPVKTPTPVQPKPVVQSTAVAKPAPVTSTATATRAGAVSGNSSTSGNRGSVPTPAPATPTPSLGSASSAGAAPAGAGTGRGQPDRSNRTTIKFGDTRLKKSPHNLW